MSDPRDDRMPGVEPPSDDVARAEPAPPLPGEHRGGFERELTAPVGVFQPVIPGPEVEVRWAPPEPVLPRSAGWGLLFGILGLVLSLLVGWGFPIGIAGVVLSVLALRRPWERRGLALWGLGLSLLSLVYSAGWLMWAASQGPLLA